MNKKAVLCLFLFLCGSSIFGQWREDVKNLINLSDYEDAIRMLEPLYEKAEEIDRPVLSALLAFVHHRRQHRESEHEWIVRYFELHWGRPVSFGFSTPRDGAEFQSFLTLWRERYPFVSDIHLIDPRRPAGSGPPDRLVIGMEVANTGLYKLRQGETVLAGSLLLPGYNTLSLPARRLFDSDGILLFILEIKSGDVLLIKKITLESQFEGTEQKAPQKEDRRDPEFRIRLLFDGETLVDSRKRKRPPEPVRTGIDFGVPYKNHDPEKRPDPLNQSFSILSAVGLAAHLIRSLAEKNAYEPLPPLRKVRMLELTFCRVREDGTAVERKAVVRLRVETEGLQLYGGVREKRVG
ncbi:MAG: hypothetical protein KKD56_04500 [Acidobacteria bacterium]|nr:hypothetical protein [Acidobacteriota bacterium]MBU1338311.1 hypothetical protein [Acidobacteriota bacterium]MBU1473916.1 hypothetical protein [Acidobacteriota bacterium]